jgi:hypothetical protein
MRHMNRDNREFSSGVKHGLAERVAYMCSNPLCRNLTIKPSAASSKAVRSGKACHIRSAGKGPRYKPGMTDEEYKAFENGIWACDKCAREIDDNESRYEADELRRWKKEAEQYVEELVTQDTRLRQLRGMVTGRLSALRILTALPGPGPIFDQTFADAGDIPLARRLIESEQLLFENDFPNEAEKVRIISDELVCRIHAAVLANPAGAYLDISEWKNGQVKVLMVDVMRFSKESYQRYLQREMQMVNDARNDCVKQGHRIHSL